MQQTPLDIKRMLIAGLCECHSRITGLIGNMAHQAITTLPTNEQIKLLREHVLLLQKEIDDLVTLEAVATTHLDRIAANTPIFHPKQNTICKTQQPSDTTGRPLRKSAE